MVALVSADPNIKGVTLNEASGSPTSQNKTPGKVEETSNFAEGTGTWTTPENAKVNDAAYATSVSKSSIKSKALKAKEFGFTIPENSLLQNIKVEIDRQTTSGSSTETLWLKVGTGVSAINNSPFDIWPNADAIKSVEKAASKWQASGLKFWSDANSASFYAEIAAWNNSVSESTLKVDMIKLTVNYFPPLTVTNEGTAETGGWIKVSQDSGGGKIVNPVVYDFTTEKQISLIGEIPSSTALWINLDNRTLCLRSSALSEPPTVAAELNNAASFLDVANTQWFKFKPGANKLAFEGSELTGTNSMKVFFQNSWV